MENKLCRSELFCVCSLLLYGSFSSTKYALTMGRYALTASVLALAAELAAIIFISLLPKANAVTGAILSLIPLCISALRVYSASKSLRAGDFGYIPLWMLLASSLLFCAYLGTKKISALGRVATLALICTLVSLLFLSAIYAKELRPLRIVTDFGDKAPALMLMLSSVSEILMIYLAGSFFACEVSDRAAKPPLEKPLSKKTRRGLYFKTVLLAFVLSAFLRLGVTAALLSVAHSRLYALSGNASVFGARLLTGVNISPLISGGIYLFTLFAFSFAICLTLQFPKMKKGDK